MNYIENVYICIIAPLMVVLLFVRRRDRLRVLFLIFGMTCCLLSSYVSTFLAGALHADILLASVEITPFIEETVKLIPVLFYLLAFEPSSGEVKGLMLMVSVGFATFENICYLISNGASNFWFLLIRGFGTGAMHVVCGALVSIGLFILWDRLYLRVTSTVVLLSVAITYHAIYNIIVSQTGIWAYIGYILPMLTAVFAVVTDRRKIFQDF